jgi:AcrR family transcriptional regulator
VGVTQGTDTFSQNEQLFALTSPQLRDKQNVHSFFSIAGTRAFHMPKLKPDTQRARREHILDAALTCFARGGFHATTMQSICREAHISPGALYVYFDSKEALIAGLCERDRAEFAERLAKLADAPNFLEALAAIGEHYFVQESAEKQRFVAEMGIEATRNPRIAEIFMSVDTYCSESFEALFQRLKDEGRITPTVDIATLARVFSIIGDGLFWRRAIHPGTDMRSILPVVIDMFGALLHPTGSTAQRNEASLVEVRR